MFLGIEELARDRSAALCLTLLASGGLMILSGATGFEGRGRYLILAVLAVALIALIAAFLLVAWEVWQSELQ